MGVNELGLDFNRWALHFPSLDERLNWIDHGLIEVGREHGSLAMRAFISTAALTR